MKKLLKKYRELIMYLIFGVLTTAVSLLIYYALVYTILNPNKAFELQIANIMSWFGAVCFAYITNRIFVFESKEKKKTKEATKFLISRITTLLMDMFIMFLFVSVFHLNDKVIKIISQIVVIVSNYLFSKLLVFKK